MRYREEFGSLCCKAEMTDLPETIIKKTSPGCTSYFYKKCSQCGNPAHSMMLRLWDTKGVECRHGDILEALDVPKLDWEHAERYHAVFTCPWTGGLDVRDLGNNNTGMYQFWNCVNIGHYSKHLDKLTDEDLDYYWDTTREDAERFDPTPK